MERQLKMNIVFPVMQRKIVYKKKASIQNNVNREVLLVRKKVNQIVFMMHISIQMLNL
jgi:hypothetical protein